ncbi:MAG TPA: hypothetical protein EYG38_12935 [Verrucomicrobia bacterium]|nr:hypothetical protein [Verrucomicrobiota bacterium]
MALSKDGLRMWIDGVSGQLGLDWHDRNDVKSGLTAAGFKFETALDMILFLKPGALTPDNGNPIRTEHNTLTQCHSGLSQRTAALLRIQIVPSNPILFGFVFEFPRPTKMVQ